MSIPVTDPHPVTEFTPTWGEAQALWNPDIDGQGLDGLNRAVDRIEAERRAAATRSFQPTRCTTAWKGLY